VRRQPDDPGVTALEEAARKVRRSLIITDWLIVIAFGISIATLTLAVEHFFLASNPLTNLRGEP
jgi:hypothetical protein